MLSFLSRAKRKTTDKVKHQETGTNTLSKRTHYLLGKVGKIIPYKKEKPADLLVFFRGFVEG
jgi:hypothetical protein